MKLIALDEGRLVGPRLLRVRAQMTVLVLQQLTMPKIELVVEVVLGRVAGLCVLLVWVVVEGRGATLSAVVLKVKTELLIGGAGIHLDF